MFPPPPTNQVSMEGWLSEDFEQGLVSVIVPTYNRAQWISSALDSVTAQTWSKIEIIVVDDGSTDDTAKLLAARIREQSDVRLQVITQTNAGVGAARNRGTRAARGEYIVYLDSDDILFPEAISNYVACLQANEAEYCFAPIDSIDENGVPANDFNRFHPKANDASFLMNCFWLVHGACYRRAVLKSAGPWNTSLQIGEDHEFLWRIKASAGRGYFLDQPQGAYRQHSREQLHHRVDQTEFYRRKIEAFDLFVNWLRETARWGTEIGLQVIEAYRFTAMRLAFHGDMKAKNRALLSVQELARELGQSLPWPVLLSWVNGKWFYRLIATLRYRRFLKKQTRNEALPKESRDDHSRLLFVSPIFPDSEGIGPARRAEMVIRALSSQYQVTLLVVSSALHAASKPVPPDYLGGRWAHIPFTDSSGLRFLRRLERRWPAFCRWMGFPPSECLHSRECREKARMAFDGQSFDLVHVYRMASVSTALFLRPSQPSRTRFWLDLDDIESLSCERLAALMRLNGQNAQSVSLGERALLYRRYERRVIPRFDRIYTCSEEDRQRLVKTHPEVRVLPNVVTRQSRENSSDSTVPVSPDKVRLLFVGLLSYTPNRDALNWFCCQVVPLLRGRRNFTFVIGGRGMSEEQERMLKEIPEVRNMGPFRTAEEGFAQGDVLVVPLRAGGGTRIKILEAFLYGKPVISTALGIEGIGAVADRDYLPAETPEDFVNQILRLCDEPGLWSSLIKHARQLVHDGYSPAVAEKAIGAHPGA